MRYLSFILALAGAAALPTAAAGQSVETALSRLEASADRAAARSASEPAALAAATVSALRAQIQLLRNSAQSLPAAERRDYARALVAQAESLALAADEKDPARARAAADDVLADLRIKAQARPALGVANALRGYVMVKVRTRSGGRDVRGLTVGANPVARRRPDMLFRFEQESSPTSKLLPPGRYEFLVLNGDKIVSRQRADVGLASTDQVNLDLPVPAALPR